MQDFISTWTNIVVDGMLNSFQSFVDYAPKIIAAIVIFSIGWILASTIKRLVIKVVELSQIEPFVEKVGIATALKHVGATVTAADLLGEIIRWAVILVFLNPTVEILGLSQVTVLINSVLLYIPRVVVASLILMLGVIFADLTAQFLKGTATALGANVANTIGVVTRYAIILFVVLAALSELGIAEALITTLFTGFVAMFAIAGGLAFGLGGKDLAAEILEKIKQNVTEQY